MVNEQTARRRELEQMGRQKLQAWQLSRLNQLLTEILPLNRFYAQKFDGLNLPFESLDQLSSLPMTTKEELLTGNPDSDHAANLTYPVDQYMRMHRTSGTHGRPMIVLDTQTDWQWWIETWQFVLDAAELVPSDRALMAFSFGPFIGFWSAHDAVLERGAMSIPAGGMSSEARLELLQQTRTTVLFCTPTYALRLAEVACQQGLDLAATEVSRLVVAGEHGGSLPAVRDRIETAWGARVIDHAGATEVGPWGYGDAAGRGLHIIESEFIAEFTSVETGQPADEGELSDLVLTTLGRSGSPLIRYQTGDRVRPCWNEESINRFVQLEGGVLGRADDMLVIRGVNIFPGSVEEIVRGFPEVAEYRMVATRDGEMDQLAVEVEDELGQPDRISRKLELCLGLKIAVTLVEAGSLPRFDAKGARFDDQRENDES
jgi:phenylacetate-CoA ligase